MADKKTGISSIGPSFLLMTAAVLFIYSLTGMTAARLNANKAAVLFAVFAAFIVFYTVSRIKDVKTGLICLVSGVPVWFISSFAVDKAFNSVQRMTIECFGIMLRFFLWGCLICLILSCASLILTKRFNTEDAVFFVLAAGFVLRAVMVLFTPLNFYQHDVSGFGPGFQGFHDDYIMYIYENRALPDGDVRDLGQLYHPPLHHILSAVFFKLNSLVFPERAGEINSLKTLPFIWSSGAVLIALKILKHFKIKGAPLVISLAFVSFHPQLVFLAIQVNNDALAMMLFTASVCLALKWYEKPELTTILFTALTIGCAMMTKLSMGFVAFPIGFLFLVRFIRAVKKKDKKSISAAALFKQFVFFGLLVFPLGLWFPVRNYITHKTPFTYVFMIDSTGGQDVWMFSAVKRLFVPSAGSLKMPFLTSASSKPEVDYNMFLALLKTSLFDERRFDQAYYLTTGRIMLILAAVLAIVMTVCAAGIAIRYIRQKKMTADYVSLLILCAVLLASFISFCFGYPVVCSESFRYVAPALPAAAVFFGLALQEFWKKLPVKIIMTGLVTAFSCAVFMFYGSYEGYRSMWELLIKPH